MIKNWRISAGNREKMVTDFSTSGVFIVGGVSSPVDTCPSVLSYTKPMKQTLQIWKILFRICSSKVDDLQSEDSIHYDHAGLHPFSNFAMSKVQYRRMYSNVLKKCNHNHSYNNIFFLICHRFSKSILGAGYKSLISTSSWVANHGVLLTLHASYSAFDGKKSLPMECC